MFLRKYRILTLGGGQIERFFQWARGVCGRDPYSDAWGYWPGQKPHSASWPQFVQLMGTAIVPWPPHEGQSKVCCASNPNEACD